MREACRVTVARCAVQAAGCSGFSGSLQEETTIGVLFGTPETDSVQIRLQGAATTQLPLAVFSLARMTVD